MASFRKYQGRAGPRYTARVRVCGVEDAKTFATLTDAKQWAKKREVELREKPYLAASEAHKHTLADAIDRYVANVLPERSASMQRDQTSQLAWWREHYGRLPLTHVQAPMLVEARDTLRKQPARHGKGTLSPASVNRFLAAIGVVLATAHAEWHWIDANPMTGVKKLREPEGRNRCLSDAELRRLLEACRISESPMLYEWVLTSLTTGGRYREVLGLAWQDVDLERGLATFRHTKNGDTRTVALSADVIALLKARRGIGKGLVFPAPLDPKRPDRPPVAIDLRSAWETALRRAGIEDFRIHDLRHTAASYLAMEGATLAELAGVLGHRTLAMVKRYSHLSDEHIAKASSRIGDRIARTGGA